MKKLAFAMALLVFMCAIFSLASCDSEKLTDNSEETEDVQGGNEATDTEEKSYIVNKNTKKFHYTDCYVVNTIKAENKISFSGNRESVINQGYVPCFKCNP